MISGCAKLMMVKLNQLAGGMEPRKETLPRPPRLERSQKGGQDARPTAPASRASGGGGARRAGAARRRRATDGEEAARGPMESRPGRGWCAGCSDKRRRSGAAPPENAGAFTVGFRLIMVGACAAVLQIGATWGAPPASPAKRGARWDGRGARYASSAPGYARRAVG